MKPMNDKITAHQIETAPKGKIIDLWENGVRQTSCVWDEESSCWMRYIPETGACYIIKYPTHWFTIPTLS